LERIVEDLKRRLEHLEAVKLLAEVMVYSVLGALFLLLLFSLLASVGSFAERVLGQLKP